MIECNMRYIKKKKFVMDYNGAVQISSAARLARQACCFVYLPAGTRGDIQVFGKYIAVKHITWTVLS